MPVGNMQMQCFFYVWDLSVCRFWYPQGSWNQSPVHTTGWLSTAKVVLDKWCWKVLVLKGPDVERHLFPGSFSHPPVFNNLHVLRTVVVVLTQFLLSPTPAHPAIWLCPVLSQRSISQLKTAKQNSWFFLSYQNYLKFTLLIFSSQWPHSTSGLVKNFSTISDSSLSHYMQFIKTCCQL